jgi:serine/threonine protein kinase
VFFELLTGTRPFTGETLELLLARHLTAPTPALPAHLQPAQPVIDQLMAKDPRERHADAQALLAHLARLRSMLA